MRLRGTQDTLRITRADLASAQESARLTGERARGGLATDLDMANALAQVEATAAAIPQLEQQEAQTMNAISLLLGQPPATLQAELSPPTGVPGVPPRVPAGLPSELARRRPDIRQAEAQRHAATASIGVAEADFYTRITLSGSFALQATQLKDLGLPARTFGFGPSVTVPIFEGRRIQRTVDLRTAQQQEAVLNHQKAVLQAFTDVDNALIAYAAEQRRRARLAEQVAKSRRALGLAQSRYRQGVSDFLEVLTAQRTVLQAEQQLADSTATVSSNLVALYKALGIRRSAGGGRGHTRTPCLLEPRVRPCCRGQGCGPGVSCPGCVQATRWDTTRSDRMQSLLRWPELGEIGPQHRHPPRPEAFACEFRVRHTVGLEHAECLA